MDFIKETTTTIQSEMDEQDFLVADFASGEHDRVPSFFVRIIPEFLEGVVQKKRTTVYSIDLHALRLDSLLGKLEESSLLERTRVVQAKLELMDGDASLQNNKIPRESFDIGVLNTDVIGYLHEYYSEYSDALVALDQVYRTIKKNGLLIVTNPCSLYVVDNVKILNSIGFDFVEGVDIELSSGNVTAIDRETAPESMSRLNHYSFLIFTKK
ncbi:MAG: hypothetical protein ACW987_14575 [Candidatus Thorarchaeota archaeon]|jgi:hypothetical protein